MLKFINESCNKCSPFINDIHSVLHTDFQRSFLGSTILSTTGNQFLKRKTSLVESKPVVLKCLECQEVLNSCLGKVFTETLALPIMGKYCRAISRKIKFRK